MYKGVIFDLDGTLVNSIEDIKNSMNRALEKYELETNDLDFYISHIGQGLLTLTKDATRNQKVELVYQELLSDYSDNYLVKTKSYPHISELVDRLSKKGIKIAVNSNKKDEFTKDIVNTLFKDIEFVDVIGDRENINKKPDPHSANEIIEKMDLDKSDIVYVGDTDHDMQTAINAEIDSIGVTWGYRSKAELQAANAKYIADDVQELESVLIK